MRRRSILDEIQGLDPERDHQRIVFLSTCYEFPFDTTRSLEFALFRTFCVLSISALLDRTGEFRERAQKRYDDTDLIVSELMERGYDSERGERALRRMNQQHGRFRIANDDFLYVLSTFIYEPIRWNARFGWRPMCERERLAMFHFWREVGLRMGIRDIPADYPELEHYNIDYERRHYRYTETNARVGAATVELFASWFPHPSRPLVRRAIYALLAEALIDGFGFPHPSARMRRLVAAGLKMRARFVGWLPARRRPRLRTEMTHPSYPRGYRIEELGPPVQRAANTEASPTRTA
jgi:mpaB/rubber oxygenase-like protein